MDRRRVGVVLHDFSLGGTERIATRLANAWGEAGAAVTLFCGNEAGPLRSMVGPKVRVARSAEPIVRGKGSRLALGREAALHFAQDRVDVLWVPGNYHWPIIPAFSRISEPHRPRIVAQVSAALIKPQRGWLKQAGFNLRMRHLLRAADEVVTLAGATSAQAKRILGHDRVLDIPLPALEASLASPQPVPEGPPVIMGAGRLVPEKGFANLIEAFAKIGHPDARLVIAGHGPDEARLRGLAEALGVASRVELPGYVGNIRPLLDRARLFVLSSDYEGYPAVLIEALAAGRRVVATDCTPATSELLRDERAGCAVPIRDVAALAIAMTRMLNTPAPDPAGLAATVSRHRIDMIASEYLELFDHVCARRARTVHHFGWRSPRFRPAPSQGLAA